MKRAMLAAIILVSACGGEQGSTPTPEMASPTIPVTASGWQPPEHPVSDEQLGRLCRAVVASIMGRPVEIISVDRSSGGEADVRYIREGDQTLWRTRCRLDGDRITWRSIDAFGPGSGLGRWRDGPDDERISVAVNADRVRVTEVFSDGSSSVNELEFE